MSDDYLSKLMQVQNPLGNAGQLTSGNLAGLMPNGTNSDIWTQAAMLENKYKHKVMAEATIDPTKTSKVLDEFTNEALDMIFDVLENNSNRDTVSNAEDNSFDTTVSKNQNNDDLITLKNVNSEVVKRFTDKLDEVFEKGKKNYKDYNSILFKVVNDKNINENEKIEIFSYFTKKANENEVKGLSINNNEKLLITQVLLKFKKDSSYSAKDFITVLSRLEDLYGVDKKNNKRSVILFGNETPSTYSLNEIVTKLYKKAQEEGVLADAIQVAPPKKCIQDKNSLGKETKIIKELISSLNANSGAKNSDSLTKKFNITNKRAGELDKIFENILEKDKLSGKVIEYKLFPTLFNDEIKLTSAEKLYILNLAYEKAEGNKDKKDGISEFINMFRKMNNDAEERYLTKLFDLYASI